MTALGRLSSLALALSLSGALLAACQSLAGITDRTYVETNASAGTSGESSAGEGGVGGAPPSQCNDYCDQIADLCQEPNNAQYTAPATCFKTCELLPVGEVIEKTGNTLLCRINQLSIQQATGEPATLSDACSSSGPGGNNRCGSNCESYCFLYKQACEKYDQAPNDTQYDQSKCVASCQGLADTGTYDANAAQSGDTLQCRLYHASAATVTPLLHCPHAPLQAQPAKPVGTFPCTDDPNSAPECASFCRLEMAECQGDDQMYVDSAQCMAVCNALPKGVVTDTFQNTIGCRKYHSYNAMFDADTHCKHTAPGGSGACGDPTSGDCESYCILAKAACSAATAGVDPLDTFETRYVDTAGCMKACAKVPPGSGYSINAKGNNVQCLLLYASSALSEPDDCAAALGTAAPCK